MAEKEGVQIDIKDPRYTALYQLYLDITRGLDKAREKKKDDKTGKETFVKSKDAFVHIYEAFRNGLQKYLGIKDTLGFNDSTITILNTIFPQFAGLESIVNNPIAIDANVIQLASQGPLAQSASVLGEKNSLTELTNYAKKFYDEKKKK